MRSMPPTSKGARSRTYCEVRALFADLDGVVLDVVRAWPYKPHADHRTSPGKFHCYWFVEGCGSRNSVHCKKCSRRNLAATPACTTCHAVMRVPGFLARQGRYAFLVRIVELHADMPRYKPGDFVPHYLQGKGSAPDLGDDDHATTWLGKLNTAALEKLDAWVPELFPGAKQPRRVAIASAAKRLGRNLKEDPQHRPQGYQGLW